MVRERNMPAGYDRKLEYFLELNKTRISEHRDHLDKERERQERESHKEAHWMKCPKCSTNLEEMETTGAKVDICPECEAMYFHRGELELIFGARQPDSFWKRFKHHFRLVF